MREIETELSGKSFRLLGAPGPIIAAIEAGLMANGAARGDSDVAELLIVSHPLLPTELVTSDFGVDEVAQSMAMATAAGRIVFVLSALASLPARRHPDYSVAMASAYAKMRAMAMQLAPKVLVNAVGIGLIEDGEVPVAGDTSMLGHVALGRPGAIADIVNAVLFFCDPANTYTTGQILNIDGGWTTGYARNF
jgi:NAD(P)-dependent dehydrogenase (short-subunit alcohol dehydrogenase family)